MDIKNYLHYFFKQFYSCTPFSGILVVQYGLDENINLVIPKTAFQKPVNVYSTLKLNLLYNDDFFFLFHCNP